MVKDIEDRFSDYCNSENFEINKEKNNHIVLEFSSPNTNKPLHLGHLRNILLGHAISNILKADGNKVTLDQSKIDAARVKLNSEAAAILYKTQRTVGVGSTSGYPLIEDHLDQLYHDMTDGKLGAGATTGNWYVGITSVKTAFPKP